MTCKFASPNVSFTTSEALHFLRTSQGRHAGSSKFTRIYKSLHNSARTLRNHARCKTATDSVHGAYCHDDIHPVTLLAVLDNHCIGPVHGTKWFSNIGSPRRVQSALNETQVLRHVSHLLEVFNQAEIRLILQFIQREVSQQ